MYPPSIAPPTAQSLLEGLKHNKVDIAIVPPNVAEEMVKSTVMLDFVSKNLDMLLYAGGDISQEAGNALASRLRLFTVIDSTEMGILPALRPKQEWPAVEWNYLKFHPSALLDFRHQSDDLYEAFVTRNADIEDEQPVFKLFAHLQEYRSGDLYSPHPTKPDFWLYRGRADDMIVFRSGLKLNPISLEQHINRHPAVRSVLVSGARRCYPAALIELNNNQALSDLELAGMIDRLWPTIQAANQEAPSYAQLSRSRIILTSPEKPMQRAGKGTVQRALTLQLYDDELDALDKIK